MYTSCTSPTLRTITKGEINIMTVGELRKAIADYPANEWIAIEFSMGNSKYSGNLKSVRFEKKEPVVLGAEAYPIEIHI